MENFNNICKIPMADSTMTSLTQAHNIDFYDCPLVRAHVEKINKRFKASPRVRTEIYGAAFAPQIISIFRRYCANKWSMSTGIAHTSTTQAYSFELSKVFKSGYIFEKSGQKKLGSIKFTINVSASYSEQTIKLVTNSSYELLKKGISTNSSDTAKLEHEMLKTINVVSAPKDSLEFDEGEFDKKTKEWKSKWVVKHFIFENSTLRMSEDLYNKTYLKMLSGFNTALQEVQKYLANCKIASGNLFNALNFCYPRSYHDANSYQTISAVWSKAIMVFPMFKKLSSEKQAELLEKAFKEVKRESNSKLISTSLYAQELYYQIVDNNLDTLMAIPHSNGVTAFPAKKKVRARWGREDNKNAVLTLLTSDKEFEEFDHLKMSPSELVWVQYGSLDNPTTYMVGELWTLISNEFENNSAFTITSVSDFDSYESFGDDEDDEEDENLA